MVSTETIKQVSSLLSRLYDSTNLGNKKNPLNELLYIMISLRTTDPSVQRTYLKFKNDFPKWTNVHTANIHKISGVLKTAGLSKQKARNLKLTLRKIKRDWNELSLRKLGSLDDSSLEKYLLTLPGVGLKSARCIMMYSFGRQVFPVDSHCFRIIKRLSWIDQNGKYTVGTQNHIQKLIPAKSRYKLHINLIQHGRQICLPVRPRCKICSLNKFCIGQKISSA